jgi:ubiquinone/menaquinone biosynthesis C-methylase UbiE
MQASDETRSRNLLRPLLKLFFYLLYHPFAWTYDLVAAIVSGGRWKEWVLQTTQFLPDGHILELGHGPGHLQARLAAENRLIFGVDRSPQMGRIAHRRLSRLPVAARLTRASADMLPFPDASFNSVTATFPTEFIADPLTMQEIHRVLKPCGQVVVLLSAWITGGSLIDRALAGLFRVTGQSQPALLVSERSLQVLADAGFEARFEWLDHPTSRLLIMIAEK